MSSITLSPFYLLEIYFATIISLTYIVGVKSSAQDYFPSLLYIKDVVNYKGKRKHRAEV